MAQVGSPAWHQQHQWITKLNMQVRGLAGAVCLHTSACSPAQRARAHGRLVRMMQCVQAHTNAQMHADEFVVELLVSLDKMQVLVHDLLLIEVRRTW